MGDVTYIYFKIITEFQGRFFSTELQSADKHTKYQKTSQQAAQKPLLVNYM